MPIIRKGFVIDIPEHNSFDAMGGIAEHQDSLFATILFEDTLEDSQQNIAHYKQLLSEFYETTIDNVKTEKEYYGKDRWK